MSAVRPSGRRGPISISMDYTAGGPIIKDKLFAFGGLAISRFYGKVVLRFLSSRMPAVTHSSRPLLLQLRRPRQPVVAQQVASLDAYLNSGISSGTYLNVYNPLNRTPVTTNVGLQPGCPASGCVITENFFQRVAPNASKPSTQWEYKIDYTPWEKDSFTARYLHARSSSNPDFLNSPSAFIGFDTEQGGPAELGEGTWTHIFAANLLNEFRVSETRINFSFAPTPQTLANPLYARGTVLLAGVGSVQWFGQWKSWSESELPAGTR